MIARSVWLKTQHGEDDLAFDGESAVALNAVGHDGGTLFAAHFHVIGVGFAFNVPCDAAIVLNAPAGLALRGGGETRCREKEGIVESQFHRGGVLDCVLNGGRDRKFGDRRNSAASFPLTPEER